MGKRIVYFDGLKLVTCYLIMLKHYFLAYMPEGFIGYGTSYAETEKTTVFLEGMPLSLFTNTSLELYIFFALIAMITTIAFYRSGNQQRFLQKQAVKRYFRFVLPVSAATLLTYGLNIAGVLHWEDVYNISGSSWILAVEPINASLPEVLYIAFIKTFLVLDTGILTVLWCMKLIFFGSLLSYGFLAVMGNSRWRYVVYLLGACFFIPFPEYAVFFVGIICGDIFVHSLCKVSISEGKRELIAGIIMFIGIAIGLIPSVFIKHLTLEHTYAIATGIFLCGFMLSKTMQKLLSANILVNQAKYTFSLLLVQIPVLVGISYGVFKQAYFFTQQYGLSFWITFIICAVISHIVAIGFYCLF